MMEWPNIDSRPCLMSTPPITQKNALLALASAASNAATVSALVTQPEQPCSSGVRTCISANPPPVTGWIRCWVGKASIPPMMRRTLLKEEEPISDGAVQGVIREVVGRQGVAEREPGVAAEQVEQVAARRGVEHQAHAPEHELGRERAYVLARLLEAPLEFDTDLVTDEQRQPPAPSPLVL